MTVVNICQSLLAVENKNLAFLLSSCILSALAKAGDSLRGQERILPLLMGELQPTIDPSLYDQGLTMGK